MSLRFLLSIIACLLGLQSHGQLTIKENVIGSVLSVQSKILNDEREIQIFLPDSYSESNKKYPVLYILDGQRYFLHGVSLQKSFVEFNQAPEFIVVGVSKKQLDRNRDFSSNSEKYLDFIKKEVIDYLDTKFRTSNEQMLFGWAYGGGFTIQTMTVEPDLFDVYIAASPFPLESRLEKIDSLLSQKREFDTMLYFTSGTDEGVVKDGTNMLKTLLETKAPKTLDWTFRELEGEEHRSTPFATLYHGIKKYFNYYPELQFSTLKEFTEAGELEYVYDYYEKRASQYGFSKELPDWTMFTLTRNAMRAEDYIQFNAFINEFQKTGFLSRLRISRACSIGNFYFKYEQYDKAIAVFELLAEKHPNSERPLNGLGDSYKALKKERKASQYYKRAEKLLKNSSN